jgi:hypothetical protein
MARTLRRTVDVVAALMGLGVVAVVGLFVSERLQDRSQTHSLAAALEEFDRTIAIQAGSHQVELTNRGYPVTIDPSWFLGSPPRNPLLSADRPWVEVATLDQAELLDPPLRIAASPETAAFWYNPYKGIVRARVPLKMSERDSVELYNTVNERNIDTIFKPLVVDPPQTEYETSPVDPHDAPFSSDEKALTDAPTDQGI